jgi:hypothetical protein
VSKLLPSIGCTQGAMSVCSSNPTQATSFFHVEHLLVEQGNQERAVQVTRRVRNQGKVFYGMRMASR